MECYDGEMISQSELDRALARWKSRSTGQEAVPTPGPVEYSGGGPVGEIAGDTSSGVIPIGDGDFENGA